MHEKGQGIIIDFTFAVFIFMIAFGALAANWAGAMQQKQQQEKIYEMWQKANLASDMLVNSPGFPSNWEELSNSDTNTIGLAIKSHSIDEQKLNAFKNMDYDTARRLLNLSEFDFYFDFNGTDTATAGLPTAADIDNVAATRIVEYKGGEAIATLLVYRQ